MTAMVFAASRTLTAPERVVITTVALAAVGLSYGLIWLLDRMPARWTEHLAVRVAYYSLSGLLIVFIMGGVNIALLAALDPTGES